MKKILLLVFCSSLLMSGLVSPEKASAETGMVEPKVGALGPIEDLKKTVVFIGKMNTDGKPLIYATGFLVNVQGISHLVTAKHVVQDPVTGNSTDNEMLIFFNLKEGGVSVRPVADMKRESKIKWIFHSDPKVDIAVLPFLITQDDDIRLLSEGLFLNTDDYYELYDVFFMSYQPGIEPKGKINPIIRTGAISLVNNDKTFYIDAFAFPGNTGSPVFLRPSPVRYTDKGYKIGEDPKGGRFVGIIGEYIPYQELAVSTQTGRPRIIFEENTGLSKVWSVEYIKEIIQSDDFQRQAKGLKGR
jgi:hypothetical protein